MPGRDGTGPMGEGPITGRGLGRCTSVNTGRYIAGIGLGLGLGLAYRRGFGRRLSRRNRRFVSGKANSTSTKEILIEQKELLEKKLNAIMTSWRGFEKIGYNRLISGYIRCEVGDRYAKTEKMEKGLLSARS